MQRKPDCPPSGADVAGRPLRFSESIYRAVFETTGSATIILEDDLTISLANEQFARLTGRPREELEGRVQGSAFVAPEHLERMVRYHRTRRADPSAVPSVYEAQLIDGAGERRDVLVMARLIPGTRRSVVSFSDVTELKRAQAAYEASKIRYRELFANMTNGVAVYEAVDDGRDFVLIDMNEAGRSLSHVSRTVVGMRVTEAFPGIKEMGLLRVLRRVWRTGKPGHLSSSSYEDSRGLDWFENHVYKLPSGEIVAIYENVTQRKRDEEARFRLQEQLHQVRRVQAMGQLAAGVAHDFNNLITVMLGSVERIKAAVAGDPESCAALQTIEEAAKEAAGVTRSLMAFGRDAPAETKIVDVRRVLNEARQLLTRAVSASIELRMEGEGESPLWVSADATQLQQVLLNLAVNARDAMPHGGTLCIRADEVPPDVPANLGIRCLSAERYVRIAVTDTGTGITPEVRERIFEPFFTTKERGRGTGLGLAIVHGIVQQDGGGIAVQSRERQGSTFTICLPRREAPSPSETQDPTRSVPHGHGERILLAEDNEHVRGIIIGALRSLGYTVDAVGEGPAILDALMARPDAYQLLVLDVDLPGANGLDCLRILRERGIHTPAILMSGTEDLDASSVTAVRATLLRKPLLMGELGRVASGQIASGGRLDEGSSGRR
ncbi:MAG: PAS domain S-box protein [Phycisphaerae bacterium]|nr:PAS domain S-box protein [Phycisphaerae bacterium]